MAGISFAKVGCKSGCATMQKVRSRARKTSARGVRWPVRACLVVGTHRPLFIVASFSCTP